MKYRYGISIRLPSRKLLIITELEAEVSDRRRDKKGRILHMGEMQMSDGRYRYKYLYSLGKECVVYSWRLDQHDHTPTNKKNGPALRELEMQIQANMYDNIATNGGNLTVSQLVEKYISTKQGVRHTTVAGYNTVINILKADSFGNRRIDTVRLSDAKCWLIKLQKGNGNNQGNLS